MAETTKTFTTEERIAFENKYNLGVYNHEAMIELLMLFEEDNLRNKLSIEVMRERIHQLEERLMEVGSHIHFAKDVYDSGKMEVIDQTLADKWK